MTIACGHIVDNYGQTNSNTDHSAAMTWRWMQKTNQCIQDWSCLSLQVGRGYKVHVRQERKRGCHFVQGKVAQHVDRVGILRRLRKHGSNAPHTSLGTRDRGQLLADVHHLHVYAICAHKDERAQFAIGLNIAGTTSWRRCGCV